MGRHVRFQEPPALPARPDPGVQDLPAWGAFASVTAAACIGWTGASWQPAAAVAVLGLACTGALWGAVRRVERLAAAPARADSGPVERQVTGGTGPLRPSLPAPRTDEAPVRADVKRRVTR